MSGPVFCAISNCENIQCEKHAGDYPACEAEITSKEEKMERILKKRFLMILMSLMLVAGFVPMTASAASGEQATRVTVGGVELNATNQFAMTNAEGNVTLGGNEENHNVMFSDGTLYLCDATIVAPVEYHGISADGYITIDIAGDNSVTGGADIQSPYEGAYGIYATGDITITGEFGGGGNLTAKGGAGSNSGGIYSFGGDVTIKGDVGKITATGENAATSSVGIGTRSGNVIIYGDVYAKGGNVTGQNGESDGICASDGSSGVDDGGNVYINGGNVEATGGTVNGDYGHSDGICADNEIRIQTTGDVSADGGAAAGHSSGICSNGGSITINANVKANGGKSAGGSIATSIAINVNEEKDIIIEGGKVYAIGENAGDISAGINARNVMIKGGALFAASVGEQQAIATSLGINGNVVVQPATGKMIAVETGSGFEPDGIGPNITIYDKAALDGSPFTAKSNIGGEEIAKAKVVNIYTGDAPDVTPGTDDPVSGDQTGNNGSDARSGGTPETGDDFNAVPMVTLMALAAAVAAGTVAYGVRRKNGAR